MATSEIQQHPAAGQVEPLHMPPSPTRPLHQDLLKATLTAGELQRLVELAEREGPDSLLGTTRLGNTALHFAAMFGHDDVAQEVSRRHPSLLAVPNHYGYTPMHLAAASGNRGMVQYFLGIARRSREGDLEGGQDGDVFLKELLLMECSSGGTALHEAMREGHADVAMDLLMAQAEAAEKVDALGHSVLYLAAMKGSLEVVQELLKLKNSSDRGPGNSTALVAAVWMDRTTIVGQMLVKRPRLGTERCMYTDRVALHRAVVKRRFDMVQLLLELCPSSAYIYNRRGDAPIHTAARRGSFDLLRLFLSSYIEIGLILNSEHQNILILAAAHGMVGATQCILDTPELSSLINQPDCRGYTALHWAAEKCNPEIIRLLLADKRVNRVATNVDGYSALGVFRRSKVQDPATIIWNETLMLLSEAIPTTELAHNAKLAQTAIWKEQTDDIKQIREMHVKNTSIVATLMSSATFAAAFSFSGQFTSDTHNISLKVFLISDVVSMCCALSVAFLCLYSSSLDPSYLLQYRSSTRALMWIAYVSMCVAFSSGMYAVLLATKIPLALAVVIFALCGGLPVITYLLINFPMLLLRLRLKRLVDMPRLVDRL